MTIESRTINQMEARMSSHTPSAAQRRPPMRPHRSPRAHLVLAVVFLGLSLAGLVGTWWFNLAFFADPGGIGYLEGWFANSAGSSAAVDLIVVAGAASILMLVEGARLGWARWVWVLVVLSFAIAVAFTFPLFLALRELRLRRDAVRG
jgi:cytochrome b561